MIEEFKQILEQRGISSVPSNECGILEAELQPAPQGVRLKISDPHGRSVVRVVADFHTAAAIVESWVRNDLNDPLMASLLPLESDISDDALKPAVAVGVGLAGSLYILGADFGSAIIQDGSIWFGGSLSGCGTVGPICLGGLLRMDGDSGQSGSSKKMNTDRFGGDLLVVAHYPIDKGKISFLPGIGLGVGWMRIQGTADLAVSDNNYEDHDQEEYEYEDEHDSYLFDQERHFSRFSMRIQASMMIAIHLKRGFALAIGVEADLRPFAKSDPFQSAGNAQIAGEPWARVGVIIGTRFGGR